VAATLQSIDYNVAMTFILNNNNNRPHQLAALHCGCQVGADVAKYSRRTDMSLCELGI